MLLYLLKMSASNDFAYYLLGDAFKNTDWNAVDKKSDQYQLVLRTLKTLTCIKRVTIRSVQSEVYREICASNLKQESSTPFLSLKDLAFFTKDDPWTSCTSGDPLIFFKSLEKREHYLKTKNPSYLRDLVKDVLQYPEAYDVWYYMKRAKEVDDKVLDKAGGIKRWI